MVNAAALDLVQLAADLIKAGANAPEAADKVLSQSAEQILVNMKQRTPVDTGRLRNSETIQAKPGMYVVGPVGVPYAIFVEFGTRNMRAQPYVRPAVQQYLDDLGANVADVGVQMILGKGL
jgi:HK97 gp10 family phage protein